MLKHPSRITIPILQCYYFVKLYVYEICRDLENPMSSEKFMKIMDQYPQYILQYYQSNQVEIEKYIVENFWEEDVERWLVAIRNRSPSNRLTTFF